MGNIRLLILWSKNMLAEGTLIDKRYKIVKELGVGGFGVVFQVWNTGLWRIESLKLLKSELFADQESLARFEREAQTLSRLEHRNIVRCFKYGIWHGQPYLTMEYFDGSGIDRLFGSQPIPMVETVDMVIQACAALGYAHSANVVHRDVKPGNLLVSANGKVKLIDFGLVKTCMPSGEGQQRLTQPGILMGSASYMSPELVMDTGVDHRADIYSLGCVLFRCLIGSPPFSADTGMGVLFKHVNEPAPSLNTVNPSIQFPDKMEALVAKCLEKDPTKRFQSMCEFSEALQEFRGLHHNQSSKQMAINPLMHWLSNLSERFCKKQRLSKLRVPGVLLAGSMLVLAALMCSWALSTNVVHNDIWQWGSDVQHSGNYKQAEHVYRLGLWLDELWLHLGKNCNSLQLINGDHKELSGATLPGGVIPAEYFILGDNLYQQKLYKQADQAYETGIRELKKNADASTQEVILESWLESPVTRAVMVHDYEELLLCRALTQALEKDSNPDYDRLAKLCRTEADYLRTVHEYAKAISAVQSTVLRYEQQQQRRRVLHLSGSEPIPYHGVSTSEAAWAYVTLAQNSNSLSRFKEALVYGKKGLSLIENDHGFLRSELGLESLWITAYAYYGCGDFKKSAELCYRAIDVAKSGSQFLDGLYQVQTFCAKILNGCGRQAESLALSRELVQIMDAHHHPKDLEYANACLFLGSLESRQRQYQDSIDHLQRALVIYQSRLDCSDQAAYSLTGLAQVYEAMGKHERALELKALAKIKK